MNLFVVTNKQFHEEFPELNGRSLTNSPSDKPYRDRYRALLKKNKQQKAADKKKAASACAPCANKAKKQTSKSTTCKADSLAVSKAGGNYTLALPGTNITFNNKKYDNVSVLEIVAGPSSKPVEITVAAKGLAGPCPEKHKGVAFNYCKEDFTVITDTDSNFKAKVFSTEISTKNTLLAALQSVAIFFDKDSYALDYPVYFNTCGFQNNAIIRVFPDLGFTASIGINYEKKFTKKGFNLEGDGKKSSEGIGQRLNYSLSLKHAGLVLADFKQKPQKEPSQPPFITFIETLADTFQYLSKGFSVFFREQQTLKISFKPSLSAAFKLKEIPSTPFVGNELSITIGFSPLFGIDATADISGALLKAVPAIGAFVAALEAVDLADVFLGFIIKGELSLEGTFSKFAQKDEFEDNKVKFKGQIKINLQGHVKSEKKIWRVKWSIGVKIGAQSGFEIKETSLEYDEKGVYIPLVIKFLGIICYHQEWANLGISVESGSVPKFTKKQDFSVGGSREEEVENISSDDKLEIIEPSELWNDKVYF